MNINTAKKLTHIAILFTCILTKLRAQQNLSDAARTYLEGAQSRISAEVEIKEGKDILFNFSYSLLFSKPAVDFRNGDQNALLLGFGLGTLKGKSLNQIARIVILSNSGEEIFKYPDAAREETFADGFFTDAIMVTMAPGVQMLAMSSPPGRKTAGSVSIRTLGQNSVEVLALRDENFPDEPGVTSDIYFYDINNDGRKELLVEQKLLHYSTGHKDSKLQIHSLNNNNKKFTDVTSTYQNQLVALFAAVKSNQLSPKISQQGRPCEPTPFDAPQ